jgi:hypothetical protein
MQKLVKGLGALVLFVGIGSVGLAAPGDIHRVTAQRANLRAGPSERTVVQTQLRQGDTLIELEREGNWLGVRALGSDKEGWVHGSLVELVSPSRLEHSTTAAPRSPGLSDGVDGLAHNIDERLRYCAIEIERVRKDCG